MRGRPASGADRRAHRERGVLTDPLEPIHEAPEGAAAVAAADVSSGARRSDEPAAGGRAKHSAATRHDDAGRTLRSALLVWGLGHLLLGDRRGWLLLALEVAAILALVVLTPPLVDGEAAPLLFLALVAFIAAWGAQAVDAYREAIARGAPRTGAAWILGLAVPAVLLVGGFWLLAGRGASPAAALEQYVTGWRHDRPDIAAAAMTQPPAPAALRAAWADRGSALRNRLVALAARFGGDAGLDPDRPFDSLRFTVLPGSESDRVDVSVEIVRQAVVRSEFLGVFPAATQERRAIEEVGRGTIVRVPGPEGVVPGIRTPVWRLERLDLEPPAPAGALVLP